MKQKNNILLLLIVLLFSFPANAGKLNFFTKKITGIIPAKIKLDSLPAAQPDSIYYKPVKHKRLKAFLLALFLGNFGAHRLYLGTSPKVIVGYSFTLGGIFILPVLDAIMILTVDEIAVYENNNNFFMFLPQPTKEHP